MQLYFPAQDGRLLVPVSRTVYSSDDVATAVFEFLRGPRADSGLETPLPQETQLLGVSVENGVVTINFSEAFTRIAEQSDGGVQAMRALMLTCTRYPGVKRVKILVDGEPYQPPTQDVPTFANVASNVENSFPEVMTIEEKALRVAVKGLKSPFSLLRRCGILERDNQQKERLYP